MATSPTSLVCACGCGGAIPKAKYPSQQSRYMHGHNPSSKLQPEAIAKRFWAKVEKSDAPDGCWLWKGHADGFGYGRLNVAGVRTQAHRYSWELTNGPIADGQFALHKCDTPACVRPEHLFLGTQADNIHDMDQKGRRGARKERAA